ncbi:MAG: hypothetical protein LBP20_02605 [Treponema sp.]|jgi:hypothetical protein|nr:hypothetical protein [Treponema sp.]
MKIIDIVSDRFGDVWKLLSETNLFISRINELPQYQAQIQKMRWDLRNAGSNQDRILEVRTSLIELRKHLRLLGYDLSLGRMNLVFDGFRHEDSMAEGFKRMVLFLGDRDLYWLTGTDNHTALESYLEQKLCGSESARKNLKIVGRHYLWYLRRKTELILSGAATESKEDYEHLKAIGAVKPLLFLSKFKGLT